MERGAGERMGGKGVRGGEGGVGGNGRVVGLLGRVLNECDVGGLSGQVGGYLARRRNRRSRRSRMESCQSHLTGSLGQIDDGPSRRDDAGDGHALLFGNVRSIGGWFWGKAWIGGDRWIGMEDGRDGVERLVRWVAVRCEQNVKKDEEDGCKTGCLGLVCFVWDW